MRAEGLQRDFLRMLRCQPVHVNNSFAYLLHPRNAPANASAPLSNKRKANRLHCDGLAESLIYFYSRTFPTIFWVMS
jgi:hypothetical protein